MSKRRIGGQSAEVLASKAERISKAAMAHIQAETQRTRAKTERLRALRLAKEAADRTKVDPGRSPAT
jgi:hypothetical protein